jgi:hypothetical protein
MIKGLYDLVREHATATRERQKEIEAERAERFPDVFGWPQYPDMVFCEVAQNAWGWARLGIGMRYVDNDGSIIPGGL